MFLFDLFADFTRPFRDPPPQTEDSDDESVSYALFMFMHAALLIH